MQWRLPDPPLMEKQTLRMLPLLVLSAVGYIFFIYFIPRADFVQSAVPRDFAVPASLFAGLFLLWFFIYHQTQKTEQLRIALVFSLAIRIVVIFAIPNFSDDYFRFLWDGQLNDAGVNPFSFTPQALMDAQPGNWNMELFQAMNSRDYYTVYPPLLQILFTVSWKLSAGNVNEAVMGLKFFVFLAESGTIFLLYQLCRKFSIAPKSVLLYALNPMVIFELSGNLHMEALMIFFLLAALWHLTELKFLPTAFFMGLAVSAKLLPLMLFPFFIRRIGWLKTLLLGIIASTVFLALFIPWLHPQLWDHFFAGLKLYFSHFEFNASFYFLGKWYWGWEAKLWLPRLLIAGVGVFILISAFLEKKPGLKNLPQMWLLAFTAYFFAATTIHPWYITTLVAFAVITPFRYPVFWTLFLPATYFTYYNGYQESETIIWIEYISVSILLLLEWIFISRNRSLEDIFRANRFVRSFYRLTIPARVKIKRDRIARWLTPGERVLDLGSGNGGLCLALREQGFEISAIDVKNQSFFPEVNPEIYDGKRLPFDENSFDTVLLITVLHHTPDPDAILAEACRVAKKRVIIMEDVYRNAVQKHLTWFTDSLVNLEFSGHPHTNRTHKAWLETFHGLGMNVIHQEQFRTLLFYTQAIYVIEKPDSGA